MKDDVSIKHRKVSFTLFVKSQNSLSTVHVVVYSSHYRKDYFIRTGPRTEPKVLSRKVTCRRCREQAMHQARTRCASQPTPDNPYLKHFLHWKSPLDPSITPKNGSSVNILLKGKESFLSSGSSLYIRQQEEHSERKCLL